MYSPESAYLSSKTLREVPLSKAEERAYDFYLKDPEMLRKRRESITMNDMDEFSDKYDEGMIERDKQLLKAQREKGGQIEKTQRAELFEFFLESVAEGADWFGDNAYLTRTLEFDDRMNHTDLVLEWEREEGDTVKLAIDCTVAEDEKVLQKKIGYTLDGIEKENLTRIKYFQSSGTDEKERLIMVPRVILALKKDKLDELCQMFLDVKDGKDGSNKKLSESHVQLYLLKEIEAQLITQLEYLKKRKFNRYGFMKGSMTDALNMVQSIIQEKESSLEQDSVQRAIKEPPSQVPSLFQMM